MSLALLERLVHERTGIDPESLGPTAFPAAVAARMNARGVASQEAYAELARANPAEWAVLLDTLVVPESWFFRGGRPLFDLLARELIEKAARTGEPARALCVPCGIGEEPFSLAIALSDLGADADAVRIDAADVNPAHLAKLAQGRFTAFSFRHMDAATQSRYFREALPGVWDLRPGLRTPVHARACNLADLSAAGDEKPYDLIVCRNVFIYLTDDARQRAVANLDRWLAADGRLCVSHAEADRLPADTFTAEGAVKLMLFKRRGEPRPAPRVPAVRAPGLPPTRPPREAIPPAVAPKTVSPPPLAASLARVRELADRGELDHALAACAPLAKGHPPSAEAFGLLGVIHLAKGDAKAAADAFTKALYVDPDHAESLEHFAFLCEQRGDRGRAAALRKKLQKGRSGGRA